MLSGAASVIAFEVTDTGIGIPGGKAEDHLRGLPAGGRRHQPKVRRHGSRAAISRELASLLGGEIQLRSAPGKGSTFTLYLPQTYVGPSTGVVRPESLAARLRRCNSRSGVSEPCRERVADDRENLHPDDTVLLIVEDDPHYARVLL